MLLLTVVAAMGVGLAQGALDQARRYMKQRQAFGRTLAEFNGLQGMLADIVVLSGNIFEPSGATLAHATVAVTIFDGKIVYRRDARATN